MTDRDRDSSLWSSDSIIATRRNRNLYSSFISVYFKSQIIAIHSMVRKHRIAAYIKGHTEQLLKICLVLKIHQVVLQNSFQYLFFYIYEIDIRSVKFIRIQTGRFWKFCPEDIAKMSLLILVFGFVKLTENYVAQVTSNSCSHK